MHLFLDLDGTLTDSFTGIARCINHSLAELGRGSVPASRLREMVGLPLTAIFGVLLASGDAALLDRAVLSFSVRRGWGFRESGLNAAADASSLSLERDSRISDTLGC